MEKATSTTVLRLAAIDLDGTLLGPDGRISNDNLRALETLANAGLEVVLASGRHYDSMLPYVEQLPMINWVVSTQGGEVSDRKRSSLLHRGYLSGAEVEQLQRLCRARELTAIAYTPDRVLTVSPPNASLELYTGLSGRKPAEISPEALLQHQVHKMVWMGEPAQIALLREDAELGALGLQTVQTFNEIYEFMPLKTTKAGGLSVLASHLGVDRRQVVVFGDGDNDIPMFQWAGASFCMPHGWPEAKQSADHVGPKSPPERALAQAIEACSRLYRLGK